MSQIARNINRITGTVIGVSGKLIIYAVVIILLVEGMTRGYAFGHDIFYATAVDPAPGRNQVVVVFQDQSPTDAVSMLKDVGLIDNEMAVRIQLMFYDYTPKPGTYDLNTSMTSKEILQILNEGPSQEMESGGKGSEEVQ